MALLVLALLQCCMVATAASSYQHEKADVFLPLSSSLLRYSHAIGRAGEDQHLQMIEAIVREDPMSFMNSAKEETKMLQLLCKMLHCKLVVEVGVYLGYTTLALAQAMPAEGRVIGLESRPEYVQRVEHVWELAGQRAKIDVVIGDAALTLGDLKASHAGRVDLIYIDADKSQYPQYFRHAQDLVRVGGLIVVDNTLVQGLVIDNDDPRSKDPANVPLINGIRNVNKMIQSLDPIKWEIVNLPFGDGVTLVLKKQGSSSSSHDAEL